MCLALTVYSLALEVIYTHFIALITRDHVVGSNVIYDFETRDVILVVIQRSFNGHSMVSVVSAQKYVSYSQRQISAAVSR